MRSPPQGRDCPGSVRVLKQAAVARIGGLPGDREFTTPAERRNAVIRGVAASAPCLQADRERWRRLVH